MLEIYDIILSYPLSLTLSKKFFTSSISLGLHSTLDRPSLNISCSCWIVLSLYLPINGKYKNTFNSGDSSKDEDINEEFRSVERVSGDEHHLSNSTETSAPYFSIIVSINLLNDFSLSDCSPVSS